MNYLKMMTRLFVLLMMILACSCTTLRSVETERVTVHTDTIVRTDTIENRVVIPGETKTVYLGRIDTVFIDRFIRDVRQGKFCLDTLYVRSAHACAWFGIRNNQPFFGITQHPIELITRSYIQRITILEQQLKERDKQVVKRYLFYENPWFWIWLATATVVVLLCFVSRRRSL